MAKIRPIEVAVGNYLRVDQLGTFKLGANGDSLLIWPDEAIKITRLNDGLTPRQRRKLDRGGEIRSS